MDAGIPMQDEAYRLNEEYYMNKNKVDERKERERKWQTSKKGIVIGASIVLNKGENDSSILSELNNLMNRIPTDWLYVKRERKWLLSVVSAFKIDEEKIKKFFEINKRKFKSYCIHITYLKEPDFSLCSEGNEA